MKRQDLWQAELRKSAAFLILYYNLHSKGTDETHLHYTIDGWPEWTLVKYIFVKSEKAASWPFFWIQIL